MTPSDGARCIGVSMRLNRALFLVVALWGMLTLGCSGRPSTAGQQPSPPQAAAKEAAGKASAAAEQPIRSGLVSYLEGTVAIRVGSETRPAEIGSAVPMSARVTTSEASRCDVTLGSLAVIRILPLTTLDLSSLDLSGGRTGALRLVAGTLAAKVSKLTDRDRFTVATTYSVAGVRGTEFLVGITQDGSTRLAVRAGEVALLPAGLDAEAFGSTDQANAVYHAFINAAVAVQAGHEAIFSPSDVDQANAAWQTLGPSLANAVSQAAPTQPPDTLLAAAPIRAALSALDSERTSLAPLSKPASTSALRDLRELDTVPAPQAPAAPATAAPAAPATAAPAAPAAAAASPRTGSEGPLTSVGMSEADWDKEGGQAAVVPRFAGGVVTFEQDTAAADDGEIDLVSKAPVDATFNDIRSLSARLGFASVSQGTFSHVAINLRSDETNGAYWVEADLIQQSDGLLVLCRAGFSGASGDVDDYRFEYRGGLAVGKAYDVRIDLDTAKGNLTWYVGGAKIASARAAGLAQRGDRTARIVLNSFRSKGSQATNSAERIAYRPAIAR